MYIDDNARSRNRAPKLCLETFFGQLHHLFAIPIARSRNLGIESDTTILLAAIRNIKVMSVNSLDMHYYQDYGRLDVVDITCLQCQVGRVPDGNKWVIIDRSGTLSRAVEPGANDIEL
jgi:hypothetical protein